MEDITQAYRELGLEPFASKEQVEQKYAQALRKHRARTKLTEEQLNNDNDQFDFDKITAAYRAILDYETKKFTEEFEQQEYGKYRKFAGQAKKLDHFWRYYKIHTFVAIILIAGIIYGISAYMDRLEEKRYLASLPPIDVSVSFLGSYVDTTGDNNFETTNNKFLSDLPQFQRVETDLILVPEDAAMQYAYMQKAVIMVATETPDIYITDEAMKEWTSAQGLYVDLETVDSLAPLVDSRYAVKGAREDMGEKVEEDHFYLIDLTESALAQGLPITHTKLYAGIRQNAPNYEKAVQFLEYYASTLPQ